MSATGALDGLLVDYVEFFVEDLSKASAWFTDGFGLSRYAQDVPPRGTRSPRSEAIGAGDIRLVLTESGNAGDRAGSYVQRHGAGVADIALTTSDARTAFATAVRRGATAVAGPVGREGFVTATVIGFGDVMHTFVQRPPGAGQRALPGYIPVARLRGNGDSIGLGRIDHIAVCVESGQLASTVGHYEKVFGFKSIFTERIVVGSQAMDSAVVQSNSGDVTLTLLEPDTSCAPGQIDRFLADHDGPGVQHIAFTAADIVQAVSRLQDRGIGFLKTPETYYKLLAERLEPDRHPIPVLQEHNILVDADHDGQLFQIFTRSAHPRNTLFMEIIERRGARTFGSANIKALYEAVELQQRIIEARA